MEIISISDQNLVPKALEVLNRGGIVIYPTETCYGVGVDATNSDAVTKVLQYKKRPLGKAISIACASEEMASRYVEINGSAKNIYKNFLPGPVTIISKSKKQIDSRLESEKETLGIRIPDHKTTLEILRQFGKPVTSTSANSAGKKTPYKIEDIFENISDKQKDLIDLIIDAGELPPNPPSSVVDTTTEDLKTYRYGTVILKKEEVSKIITTDSEEETIQFAKDLMINNLETLKNDYVLILLNGELGAGKTHFVKGIAKALNIQKIIKSPTYGYVDEHKFEINNLKGILYHVDAWKIEDKETLNLLRPNEWFKKGNVICIEWANVILKINPNLINLEKTISINIEVEENNKRTLNLYN